MKLPKPIRHFFRKSSEKKENTFYTEDGMYSQRDRPLWNYRTVIEESLRMWREDPLARRIVTLTTQFAVGHGFSPAAEGEAENDVLQGFWNSPLNAMNSRIREWSDELCRTGNLFIMISSDQTGNSYVRAIPAAQIEEIIPRENDLEQPLYFRLRELPRPNEPVPYTIKEVPAADLLFPNEGEAMLHFTVNRPIGAQWGEPDLAPLLQWFEKYSNWLADRYRLNHYRNCFMYVVKCANVNEAGRIQRQRMLNLHPPAPGSILVVGPNEEWTVLNPALESEDANEDGMAFKKMIAAGAGIPLNFLAESGSSALAESSSSEDACFANFAQRRQLLRELLETLLRHVLARASLCNYNLDPNAAITIHNNLNSVVGEQRIVEKSLQ